MTKISNQYSLTNILTADLANSRLGINNVSPTVALDVTGAGKFSGALTGTTATFRVSDNRNLAIKYDTNITLSGQADSGAPENLRIYADTFKIFTSTTTVGLTERLTISNTGAATFQSVNAKVNTGGWHLLVQDNTSMAAGVGGGIQFNGYKTGTSAQGVYAAIDGIKENGTSANELGAFRIWTSNGTNLAERLRITSAGNVAINNTTGTIYSKLSVAGGIAFGNNTDSNLGNKSYGNAFSKQSTVVAGGATVTIKPTIGAESSLILVSGIVEATGNRFADLILIIGAGGTPLVVGSRTFQTPATRTYTNGGENLRLQLTGSSETYIVWITGFGGNESS